MADIFVETSRQLTDLAAKTNSVLVSFSGGRDSLVVLDLCCRAFQRVVPFFMDIIPGLRCVEERLQYASERWKVEILRYPHWVMFKALATSTWCKRHISFQDLPKIGLADIYDVVKNDTGLRWIAHGGKDADGLWRRRMFSNTAKSKKYEGVFYPIKGWTTYEVLAYLELHKIPVPNEPKAATHARGLDLGPSSILWLHDNHPDDYKLLLHMFPFAEAVVWRRTYHGIGTAAKTGS